MQAVAGILPFDNVGNAHGGKRRIAFHEQVGVLVMITEEPFGRCIALRKRQMAGKMKPGAAPRGDELVRLRPAVEADAEGIGPKNAEDLGKRRSEPGGISIVRNAPAVARAVTDEVWRVG